MPFVYVYSCHPLQVEFLRGSSCPSRNAGSPICKAESFAGLGFLAAPWRVVCDFAIRVERPHPIGAFCCRLQPVSWDLCHRWLRNRICSGHGCCNCSWRIQLVEAVCRLRTAKLLPPKHMPHPTLQPVIHAHHAHACRRRRPRLQSWGAQGGNQVAKAEQLEAARVKRIAQALAASLAAPASHLPQHRPRIREDHMSQRKIYKC